MRKLVFILFCLVCVYSSDAQQHWSQQQEAIMEVIEKAYVQGLQNGGDLKETEKGFHPAFNLLIYKNNNIEPYPIGEWIDSSQRKKAQGVVPGSKTVCKYQVIDITGHAAMAKIELYRANKIVYTDYLSLYKFSEGWRIVSKIYNKH